MDNSFTLEIVKTEKRIFKGEVISLSLYSTQGSLTILANHAPLVTELIKGNIRFRLPDGDEKDLPIKGGFLEVLDNSVIILEH